MVYRTEDGKLNLNDRDILAHAGSLSHEMTLAKAEVEYDRFNSLAATALRPVDADRERAVCQLPKPAPKRQKKKP